MIWVIRDPLSSEFHDIPRLAYYHVSSDWYLGVSIHGAYHQTPLLYFITPQAAVTHHGESTLHLEIRYSQ